MQIKTISYTHAENSLHFFTQFKNQYETLSPHSYTLTHSQICNSHIFMIFIIHAMEMVWRNKKLPPSSDSPE